MLYTRHVVKESMLEAKAEAKAEAEVEVEVEVEAELEAEVEAEAGRIILRLKPRNPQAQMIPIHL